MKCREQRMTVLAEVRAKANSNKVYGYAAKFNSQSDDLGGYREMIRPGAFKRTLDNKADVRLLVNHEGVPIGRTKSGTLLLQEDDTGLYFECELDVNNPKVAELKSALQRGDIDQCSFGFFVQKDSWGKDVETGKPLRTLIECELFDISIVTIPAYPATKVALRSLFESEEKMQELFNSYEGDEIDKIYNFLRRLKEEKSEKIVCEKEEIKEEYLNSESNSVEDSDKPVHSIVDENPIQENDLSTQDGERERMIKLMEL